jgi:hypothetical protein
MPSLYVYTLVIRTLTTGNIENLPAIARGIDIVNADDL